jgi:hypothetical protein
MKGTRFEAVSSTQQTMTRELKAKREEAFSRAFDLLYERYKRSAERAGIIFSDNINIYLFFVWFLWPQLWNLIVTLCITDTPDPQNTTK